MPTVLVVEDEPVLRASMVRGLAKLSGVSVLAAGSVDEACAIIGAAAPQLVITDLNLPGRSGLEVIAELDRVGARVPVVVASAYLRRFDVPQRPGVVLLEKPVALSQLREVVVKQLALETSPGPFSLADYVQLAGMGRRSVSLDVARDGRSVGEVAVHQGEAWHARDAQGAGPEALSRLLDAADVAVTARPLAAVPERTLEGSCESALLDHLRRQDEAARPARGTLPYDLSTPPAPHDPPSAEPAPTFAALYERGVEALLDREYHDAFEAFAAASRLGSSPSLTANLARLRTLGFGS